MSLTLGVVLVGDVAVARAALAGVPLVHRAVRALLESGAVARVVVAADVGEVGGLGGLGDVGGLGEATRLLGEQPAVVVLLGVPAATSVVELLLTAMSDQRCDLVLVHDCAHGLAPAALARDVAAVVAGAGEGAPAACVPVAAATDTLKQVDSARLVVATLDRRGLGLARFPQAYRGDVLRSVLSALSAESSGMVAEPPGMVAEPPGMADGLGLPADLLPGLVQAAGWSVATVPAPEFLVPIEDMADLETAAALLPTLGSADSPG